ncbi:MAG: transglutaminase-like domain-containing protein [Vicinamibacterales bacterium]
MTPRKELVEGLQAAANAPGGSLAPAALVVARLEYPQVDTERYLAMLDGLGDGARRWIEAKTSERKDTSMLACIKAFNEYLFAEQGFRGNQDRYDDPRNSCLNEVLDRRTGIPITLSLVYMEIGRRAGLRIDGVNFPGHFLVRCPEVGGRGRAGLIVDPFHGGALLSEDDCRVLLEKHVGQDIAFSRSLLAPATRQQIIVRMLINLKRLYVHMRSFPQAREVTEMLLAMTPSALSELRDRGLLAYHLNDVAGALRDLQTYLKLSSMSEMDKQERAEYEQIWEHVKTLRRRVASLN